MKAKLLKALRRRYHWVYKYYGSTIVIAVWDRKKKLRVGFFRDWGLTEIGNALRHMVDQYRPGLWDYYKGEKRERIARRKELRDYKSNIDISHLKNCGK